MAKAVIIISTFSNEESGANVARKVIGKKLCACANITKVRSIYSWNGRMMDQPEFLVFFKTTAQAAKKLKGEIAKIHPYDVPEIVEVTISDVSKPYLSWLAKSTDSVAKKRHHTSK